MQDMRNGKKTTEIKISPPKKDDVYNLCFQLSKIIKGDPGHIRESNPSPKSPPLFPSSPDPSKKLPLPK